jgi:hypothetical protein
VFERGLPGYDDWLDNHGNPGIWESEVNDFDWAIEEPVYVTLVDENPEGPIYKINRIGTEEIVMVTMTRGTAEESGQILFDGRYVDVGDSAMSYVCLIDDYHQQGGALNTTIRSEPFCDEH